MTLILVMNTDGRVLEPNRALIVKQLLPNIDGRESVCEIVHDS